MSSATFEGSIGVTVISYTINDLSALKIFTNHIINGIGIILQISIHGNHGIDLQPVCMHQTGKQSILMPSVVG